MNGRYECPKCSLTSRTSNNIKQHIERRHQEKRQVKYYRVVPIASTITKRKPGQNKKNRIVYKCSCGKNLPRRLRGGGGGGGGGITQAIVTAKKHIILTHYTPEKSIYLLTEKGTFSLRNRIGPKARGGPGPFWRPISNKELPPEGAKCDEIDTEQPTTTITTTETNDTAKDPDAEDGSTAEEPSEEDMNEEVEKSQETEPIEEDPTAEDPAAEDESTEEDLSEEDSNGAGGHKES